MLKKLMFITLCMPLCFVASDKPRKRRASEVFSAKLKQFKVSDVTAEDASRSVYSDLEQLNKDYIASKQACEQASVAWLEFCKSKHPRQEFKTFSSKVVIAQRNYSEIRKRAENMNSFVTSGCEVAGRKLDSISGTVSEERKTVVGNAFLKACGRRFVMVRQPWYKDLFKGSKSEK